MVARLLMTLAILAVFVRAAPLRSCAVAEQVVGANCHQPGYDSDGAAARGEGHGPDHRPCERGPACPCQLPRLDADKARCAAGPDLWPPRLSPGPLADEADPCSLPPTAAPARPPDVPLAVHLPLLN